MKRKLAISVLLVISFLSGISQTTLTLQPGPEGKDALLHGIPSLADSNLGNSTQFPAATWTAYGDSFVARSIIEFDLSLIPDGATIVSAYLSLYAIDPATASIGMGSHEGTANNFYIRRITSNWDEMSVTWNTQPSTTSENQIELPATTDAWQNFENIDVKALIEDMIDNRTQSFGFMLLLQNEVLYNRVNFAASDHENSSLRPKLVITYILAGSLILQPDGTEGKDALLHGHSNAVNTNMGNSVQHPAAAWTAYGENFIARSIVEFNLISIPSNAVIDSAWLTLFAIDAQTASVGMGIHEGDNACWIERITSTWDENTVTWNTQPTTTTENRVATPVLSDPDAGIKANVKTLVQDMINNPGSSYGFMIKIQDEQIYRKVNFASSDHAEEARRPKLEVYYSTVTGSELKRAKNDYLIYPNPNNGKFKIELNQPSDALIHVFNINGKLIKNLKYKTKTDIDLSLNEIPKGIYFVKIKICNQTYTEKVIIW